MALGRSLGVASAVALAVAGAPAAARAQRILVLQPDASGPVAVRLPRCISEGLLRAGAAAVPGTDTGTCPSQECLAQACEVAGSEGALRVSVTLGGRNDYAIRLELFHANGTPAAQGAERCVPCSETDLCESVAVAVSELSGALGRLSASARTARLTVNTTPAGAQISFGSRALGPSPLEVDLAPGVDVVRAALAGYRTAERTVTLVANVPLGVEFTLERNGPRGPLWPSLALGALGLAAAGLGGYWTATDGVCLDEAGRGCALTAHRQPQGWIAIGAGAAALATAIIYYLLR